MPENSVKFSVLSERMKECQSGGRSRNSRKIILKVSQLGNLGSFSLADGRCPRLTGWAQGNLSCRRAKVRDGGGMPIGSVALQRPGSSCQRLLPHLNSRPDFIFLPERWPPGETVHKDEGKNAGFSCGCVSSDLAPGASGKSQSSFILVSNDPARSGSLARRRGSTDYLSYEHATPISCRVWGLFGG